MIHGTAKIDSKIYKHILERRGKINCGFCRYNRGENANRKVKADRHKNINRESVRYLFIDEIEVSDENY